MLHLLPAHLFSITDLFGIFDTLQEMDFVIRIMLFSYLLFWLYTTFIPARADLLFGLSAIAAGYLVFAHGVTITILVLFFILFVVLGSQLQMLLQFGIMPLLGYQYHGDRFKSNAEINAEYAKMGSGQPGQQGQQGQYNAQELGSQYYSQEEQEQSQMNWSGSRMRGLR